MPGEPTSCRDSSLRPLTLRLQIKFKIKTLSRVSWLLKDNRAIQKETGQIQKKLRSHREILEASYPLKFKKRALWRFLESGIDNLTVWERMKARFRCWSKSSKSVQTGPRSKSLNCRKPLALLRVKYTSGHGTKRKSFMPQLLVWVSTSLQKRLRSSKKVEKSPKPKEMKTVTIKWC